MRQTTSLTTRVLLTATFLLSLALPALAGDIPMGPRPCEPGSAGCSQPGPTDDTTPDDPAPTDDTTADDEEGDDGVLDALRDLIASFWE